MVHEGGWQVVRTEHRQVLAISPSTRMRVDPRPRWRTHT
jgi:carboxylesterase type B